jgi:hypothetical protein
MPDWANAKAPVQMDAILAPRRWAARRASSALGSAGPPESRHDDGVRDRHCFESRGDRDAEPGRRRHHRSRLE